MASNVTWFQMNKLRRCSAETDGSSDNFVPEKLESKGDVDVEKVQ